MSKKHRFKLSDLSKLAPWAREQILAEIAQDNKGKKTFTTKKQQKVENNPTHWQKGKEKDFQRAVNEWLESVGFAKRNSKSIAETEGKGGVNGWQIHVHRAVGNPILLDVLLLRNNGKWLEFELKTAQGALSENQTLLAGDGNRVCRSMEEVMNLVNQWLNEREKICIQ